MVNDELTTEELLVEDGRDDGKPVGTDQDEEEIQPYEGATEVADPEDEPEDEPEGEAE